MAAGSSFAPLRHRSFRRVWTGSFVSNVGTWMQTAVLADYVARSTGKASWSALVAAAEFIPTGILALLGGALADRRSRKQLLLGATLAQALLTVGLTALLAAGEPGPGIIALYALLNGTAWAIGFPSFQAILPELVPSRELPAAIGLSSAQWNLGRVIGPTAGVLLYSTTSITTVLAVNAASFFAVLVALAPVALPKPDANQQHPPIIAAVVEGFRYVRNEPGLRVMLRTMCLNTFFIAPFIGLIAAFVVKELEAPKQATGILITAQGLGAVAIGLSLGAVTERLGTRRLMTGSMTVLPVTVIAYALAPNVALAAVALFFVGLCYFAALSSFTTVAQRRAANELRGRVMAINNVVLGVLFPLGLQVQGRLGDRVGLREVTVVAALIVLVVMLLTRLTRPRYFDAVESPVATTA